MPFLFTENIMKDAILNKLFNTQNVLTTLIEKEDNSDIYFFDFNIKSHIDINLNIEFDLFDIWIEFEMDNCVINLNFNLFENDEISMTIYQIIDKENMVLSDEAYLYDIELQSNWTDIFSEIKSVISTNNL